MPAQSGSWGRPSFRITDDHLACPHVAARGRRSSKLSRLFPGVPLMRALIPLTGAPPPRPSHLPKAPLPKTITLGIRISTYELGRGGHKHSVHNSSQTIIAQESLGKLGRSVHSLAGDANGSRLDLWSTIA